MPGERADFAASGPGTTAIGIPSEPTAIEHDIIQGGEVVILNLRPHVGSVALRALPIAVAIGAIALAAVYGASIGWPSLARPLVVGVVLAVAVFAFDWKQTRYVLTDRRVMVVRGGSGFGGRVVVEALVPALHRVSLEHSVRESVMGLGTLEFVPDHGEVIRWEMLGRAEDVYAIARDAIERYGRGRLDE